MKAFWLLLLVSLKLSLVATYCPDKCLCLWNTEHLLTINCSGSEQTEVPYGIDPQVKFLDLSYNEIKTYNHSKYLKIVEKIDLSNNEITEAYFGGSFKYLERIDLSYNFISDLRHVDVENLKQLKLLNLSYNPRLQYPSGLKSESLEFLDLNHCYVTFVHKDFLEDVPNVRILDLSFNSIRSLSNIRSDSLEHLDASHGELRNLTQFDIFNLPNLTKLNVSFNSDLKIDFSYENSCWNVKELDVSNSELDSLEDMFPFCSLEILNASVNKIKIIEVRTFFNNCELISVNLSNNHISDIQSRSFFTTDKIKVLDLSANQIQNLDFTLHLKQISDLDLSRNHISSLKGLLLKKLTALNLSQNRIKEISINFNENAPKLKNLNLSHNKIKHLDKINSNSIVEIDLSHCKISSIDVKTFENARNLIKINLAGNKLASLNLNIFKDLGNLKELMLAHNPWSCICQSQEFKGFYEFLAVDRPIANVQALYCARDNQTWRNSCVEVWHKEKEWKKTVYSLSVSLAIALIVVAVIFFCKYFNDRKRMEEAEREARERRENIGRRLSSFQNSSQILHMVGDPEVPNRSSTPPPNYEAALLLPKLTEHQRKLAISTLSIASPDNEEEESREAESEHESEQESEHSRTNE